MVEPVAKSGEVGTTEALFSSPVQDGHPLIIRSQAVGVLDALQTSALAEIVSASAELFAQALELYRDREDKEWGLTDCASFVVMTKRGLRDALTTDEHFRQAGVCALLRDD